MSKPKKEEDRAWDGMSFSQDRTDRFPTDQLIRKRGYTIKRRKGNDIPVWSKNGKDYPQDRVLEEITLSFEEIEIECEGRAA